MVRTKRAKPIFASYVFKCFAALREPRQSFTQSREEKKDVRREEEFPVSFSSLRPTRPEFDQLFGHPKAEVCEGLICSADCPGRDSRRR